MQTETDKAIEIIAEGFDLDLGDLAEFYKNTGLGKDYINQDQYCWNLYLYRSTDTLYENYNARVDARNGNIISYSNYSYAPYYYDYGYYGYDDYYDYDGSGAIKGRPEYKEPEYLYTYDDAKKSAQ